MFGIPIVSILFIKKVISEEFLRYRLLKQRAMKGMVKVLLVVGF